MKITRSKIAEGQSLPPYYGVSWACTNTYEFVCHPYPFNIIFGFIRKLYIKIRWFRLEFTAMENYRWIKNENNFLRDRIQELKDEIQNLVDKQEITIKATRLEILTELKEIFRT